MTKRILEKIRLTPKTIKNKFDLSNLENIEIPLQRFIDHKEIAKELASKDPYLISIIIENLKSNLWRRKKYAKQTKVGITPKYTELLYKYFFEEYGERKGNEIYAGFLEKYRPFWEKEGKKKEIDDYILDKELEPRYREKILNRYKNIKKLKAPRHRIKRERYYHLPSPLDRIDWRNPYDNIFVWYENDRRFAQRGGSGSSGQRETNSEFIFGFSLINQNYPVPTYLFLYNSENKLLFIKKFRSLCVPAYDIGSNYYLPLEERERVLKKTRFLRWDLLSKVEEIAVTAGG